MDNIEHVVVLMLENRSFDHMLGWLYTSNDNLSPLGHPYEGLTGNESNRDSSGQEIKVFKINPGDPHACFMPGVNPGEGYARTNAQLFGTQGAPPAPPQANESNIGFLRDFEQSVAAATQSHSSRAMPGTTPNAIMGCFTPEALPILSGLARGYAVCDRWFGSVPTETMPNRAFALAATSLATLEAIIACLPEAERNALIDRITFREYTPATLTSPEMLRLERENVAQERLAYDDGETNPQLCCISAPIFDGTGYPVGSIGISMIYPLFPGGPRAQSNFVAAVSQTAQEISAAIVKQQS